MSLGRRTDDDPGGFIADYNSRFARTAMNGKDLHRPLSPQDDLDEIPAWREQRTVTRNLTLHYDRMMLILDPTPLARGLARQKVDVVNYTDGRFAVRFNGTELPFKVFDKIRTVEPETSTYAEHLMGRVEGCRSHCGAAGPVAAARLTQIVSSTQQCTRLGSGHAQAREAALVVMLVQFRPLDRRAVGSENAANVVGMRQQFAGRLDGGISRPSRARLRQPTRLSKDHMPHRFHGSLGCSCLFAQGLVARKQQLRDLT